MKKYTIGGSKGLITFITIWGSFCVLFFTIIFSIFIVKLNLFFTNIVFIAGILSAFISNLIMFLILYIPYRRMRIALNGHKTTGKIENFYIRQGRYVSYVLEVIYRTDNNDKAIFKTYINPKDAKYFKIGDEIPLYVNNEFAYFKIDEIKNRNEIIY